MKIKNVSQTSLHIQRSAITVSFRRKLLTLRQLYPRAPSRPSVSPCRMGRSSTSTSLFPQLVQAVILPQHGAFVDSKGSVNLLRINCVSLTNLHTRRVLTLSSYTMKRNDDSKYIRIKPLNVTIIINQLYSSLA